MQRYRCKDCTKTFSKTTNSLCYYSKIDYKKWLEFLELMTEMKSLRFCAKKLSINLTTAFYWRHKILHGLSINTMLSKMGGFIHINKTIIKENLKGCRKIFTNKRRNIWVVGAMNNNGSMLAVPFCKDIWDLKKFKEKVYWRFEKESILIAYNERYLECIVENIMKER